MKPKPKPPLPSGMIMVQIFICIAAAAWTLYAYIEKQNEITKLRLEIPTLAKEVKRIQEENTTMQYEINQFESPVHLMELVRKPEFAHLKYPFIKDILILPEGSLPSEEAP